MTGFFMWLATSLERCIYMACNLMLPHEDNIQNKFRIWKKRAYSDEKTVPVDWLK